MRKIQPLRLCILCMACIARWQHQRHQKVVEAKSARVLAPRKLSSNFLAHHSSVTHMRATLRCKQQQKLLLPLQAQFLCNQTKAID